MTENDLDNLIREVLMDSIKLEWAEELNSVPSIELSKKFRKQMKAMLTDPFLWSRKKTNPIWRKAVNRVASIFITILVGFGSVMIASPTVRAAVFAWVREWYDTHIEYQYKGKSIQTAMPQYQITDLPDGYSEAERLELSGYISVTYKNKESKTLYLDYAYIQEGIVSSFEIGNNDITDISVNKGQGQLFLSQDSNQSNSITWIDGEKNIQFTIDGYFDETELLYMAENISLID